MKHKFIVLVLVLSLLPLRALAGIPENAILVITQVQVSGAGGADDEFIEIKNVSTQPVPLLGWSIQYRSSTGSFPVGSKRNLPDFVLAPHTYYLIAKSSYTGLVVPDLVHSSFSLSGATAGGNVYLVNGTAGITSESDPLIMDKIAYGTGADNSATNAPLPLSGESLLRVDFTGVNSADFVISEPKPRNSSISEMPEDLEEYPEDGDSDQQEDPENDSGEASDEGGNSEENGNNGDYNDTNEQEPEENEVGTENNQYSKTIKISEVMPNPPGADPGQEWIELYNNSSTAVDIKHWILDDDGPAGSLPAKKSYVIPSKVISAKGYAVITIPKGRFSLINSTGDEVRLFWPDKNLADKTIYRGSLKDTESWCLLSNEFQTCEPTPGEENKALQIIEEEDDDEEDVIDYENFRIIITAILPDPAGADAGNEQVNIKNTGSDDADMAGWILDDGVGTETPGSTSYSITNLILEPGEETEIVIPKGRFTLNNSKEDGVRLFSHDKVLRDSVKYAKAEQGKYYVRSGDGWSWQEDGLVQAATFSAKSLPITGVKINKYLFVISTAIWYIGYGFSNKQKGNYEQTRSH